jgi:hypothetical protein
MYYDDDDDFRYTRSNEDIEKDWKQKHRDVFKQGKWKKIQGRELTQEDIGKRIKFLWFIEWENDTTDLDGILTSISTFPDSPYYFLANFKSGKGRDESTFGYNVYDQTVYVQTA